MGLPTEQLTGSSFEKIIQARLIKLTNTNVCSVGRYGTQASVKGYNDDGTVHAQLMKSLPDFEGVIGPFATQVCFDAKVCSQASFDLNNYRAEERKAKSRQLRHMYERDRFGSVCFFLIHWNPRTFKRKADEPAETFAVPVSWDAPLWRAFEAAEIKSINREDCQNHGITVDWTREGGERKFRPDLHTTFDKLLHKKHPNVHKNPTETSEGTAARSAFAPWTRPGPIREISGRRREQETPAKR